MMELHQLKDALSQDDADPQAVQAQLSHKRQTRHRRQLLMTGTAALSLLAAAAGSFAVINRGADPRSTPSGPAVVAADGCADIPLADRFPRLRAGGASVITGRGVLTGRTGRDGVIFHEMTLHDVRTLAGPTVPDDTTVWVETPDLPPQPDPIARGNPGPLWGPQGALFGIILPQKMNRGELGNTISQAPLVDGQVILGSSGGCWSIRDLQGKPFDGPLTEISGSGTYARASTTGFTAVPLVTLEQLAAHP